MTFEDRPEVRVHFKRPRSFYHNMQVSSSTFGVGTQDWLADQAGVVHRFYFRLSLEDRNLRDRRELPGANGTREIPRVLGTRHAMSVPHGIGSRIGSARVASYTKPAALAHRYLAPSTATGFSAVYGYARMLRSSKY